MRHWSFYLIGSGLYIALFYLLFLNLGPDTVKRTAVSVCIIPIVFIANRFGRRAGIAAGVLSFPLNLAMLYIGGDREVFGNFGPFFWVGQAMFLLIGGVVGYLSDVRARLRADLAAREYLEESLRQAEINFRALFNQYNDGVVLIGLDSIVRDVNTRALELIGYSAEEVIGKNTSVFLAPGELADRDRRMAELREKGRLPVYQRLIRHKDGREFPVEINITLVRDLAGSPLYTMSIFRDVSQRKAVEDRLTHLATHDPLTGLPNRKLFNDRLQQALARADRHKQPLAVLFIDMDDFKGINDTFGHAVGDHFLTELARRMAGVLRASDTLARMGGDEFAIILENAGRAEIEDILARLGSAVHQPFPSADRLARTSASIGVSLFPHNGRDPETLLAHADTAMYAAKNRGKNRTQFFDPQPTSPQAA
jgi:diguanylate cyclase (GGDEF)-like protein/PAS domain S-box-containing protein